MLKMSPEARLLGTPILEAKGAQVQAALLGLGPALAFDVGAFSKMGESASEIPAEERGCHECYLQKHSP